MPQQSVPKAAAWMAGWLVSMLAMAIAGREVAGEVPVVVLMFLRSAIGTCILLPVVFHTGLDRLYTGRLLAHAGRNAIHYTAQFAWFFALTLIPLAEVVSIEFTTPLWAAVLAVVFLSERMPWPRLFATGLGFAGILVIVRPGFASIEAGQLWALYAACGFAISVVLTKFLTRTDSAFAILCYMVFMQAAIGLVPALWLWKWPQAHGWAWVIVAAIAGLTSHYSLARA
ncbi:MAG TPA: DMT family transporter, partial [Rhizobiales bacterium]|nr:DMT family transporter [Hyphomicrobiales bacterium]